MTICLGANDATKNMIVNNIKDGEDAMLAAFRENNPDLFLPGNLDLNAKEIATYFLTMAIEV